MSFFNWFSGKSVSNHATSADGQPEHDSSGLTRDERTRPVAGARPKSSTPMQFKTSGDKMTAEQSSGQKSQRHAKRELLYAAVREAMIRAGVLSASYKFKVLSLDPRGDQFMVMMDLAQEFGGQTDRLAEIEVLIAQSAKSRYNIRVTAVYWRMNELVAVGRPGAQAAGHSHVEISRPAPLSTAPVMADATVPEPVAESVAELAPVSRRYEPIQADEVAAFKQALAAASAVGIPQKAEKLDKQPVKADKDHASRSSARSYTLLTGFEDTEMPDMPVSVPALSATQYGDLI